MVPGYDLGGFLISRPRTSRGTFGNDVANPAIVNEPRPSTARNHQIEPAVVHGARYGHDIAARAHIEEEGWDATTFGVNRYRLSWRWIDAYSRAVPGVQVTYPDQCLRVRWGGFELGFYNGRGGADRDVRSFDFAATARRAEVGRLNQPTLPGMEIVPAELQHLLVAYAGSPANGCEAIYVGAPIADPATKYTSWAWIEPIWQFDPTKPGTGRHDAGTFTDFRDLDIPDLEVDLRDDDASDTGS